MALPFPYRKKRDVDNRVPPDPPINPRLPPNIDPDYVPPVEESTPILTAPQEPAVDPKLLAAASERAVADPSTPPPTKLSAMPEPPPEMEWNPIVTDKSGRPKVSPTAVGDPGRILEKQREAVDRYEPKSESKWKRWLRIGLGAGSVLAGAAARDPRAVAMAAEGLGRNIGSGKWPDEYWKREQQAEIGKRLDEVNEREKDKVQLAHTRAQTKKLGETPAAKPRALKIETDAEGFLRTIDTDSGKADFVRDERGQPVRAKANVRYDVEYDEATGKTYRTENGKRMGLLKAPDVIVPGYGAMSPGSKFNSDAVAGRQAESEDRRINIKNQETRQKNARIQANIAEATEEKDKVERALKDTAPMIKKKRRNYETQEEETYEEPNPKVEALENRRDQLIDKIRTLNTDIEPIVKPPPRPTRGAAPAVDLTGQQRSVSVWRKKYPSATAQQEAAWKAKVEAAGGSVIK